MPWTVVAPIAVAGEEIPAGSMVFLCTAAANREPSVWKNADLFEAARFADPSTPCLLTFGAGPHHYWGRPWPGSPSRNAQVPCSICPVRRGSPKTPHASRVGGTRAITDPPPSHHALNAPPAVGGGDAAREGEREHRHTRSSEAGVSVPEPISPSGFPSGQPSDVPMAMWADGGRDGRLSAAPPDGPIQSVPRPLGLMRARARADGLHHGDTSRNQGP